MMDCRVWVATEWIVQCAEVLFEEMSSKKELNEAKARVLRTGSLCGNDDDDEDDGKKKKTQPLSVARWEFWKRRFKEIAAHADELGLDGGGSTVKRISDALKRMSDVDTAEE